MNTAQLNAEQIGSANTLPGIYIRGALAVYAVSVAVFSSVGFQEVYGAALAEVSAKGLFGAVFQVLANTEATATGSFVARAIAYLRCDAVVNAATTAMFGVGTLARVYGAASIFVVGRWTLRVKVAFKAITSAVVETLSKFGVEQTSYGASSPSAESTAEFTTFGEYAPESRFIIVQVEDRKAVVV